MISAARRSVPLIWVPLLLIACALLLRWFKLTSPGMNLLPNFSPWMALAFTGTLMLPRALPWFVWPLAMLLINMLALGAASALDPESLAIYAMYAAAAWVASRYRQRLNVLQSLLGVALCGLAFYGVTNSVSWMVEPPYAKTFAGWLQALTTGLPGYAPTWTFFRASLLSDLGFSAMLILAFNAEARFRSIRPMPWVQPVSMA